jgi:hypothetical protein
MHTGSVTETRYSVNPDNTDVSSFCSERHFLCITSSQRTGQRTGEAVVLDGATVISQLTNALTLQNEYPGVANAINQKN